jgi:hypothetical protein
LKDLYIIKKPDLLILLLFFILIIPTLQIFGFTPYSAGQYYAFISIATFSFWILGIYRIKSPDHKLQPDIFKLSIFKYSIAFIIGLAISILFAVNQIEAINRWFMIFTFFMIFLLFSFFLSTNNRTIQFIKFIFLMIAIAGLSINLSTNFKSIDQKLQSQDFVDLQKSIDQESLNMFDQNRLFGVGLANWKIKIGDYHPSPEIFNLENNKFIFPSGLHYIILAETGILGLLFYFTLLIILIYYVISTYRNSSGSIAKITSIISLISLLIITVFDCIIFSPDQNIKYIYISFFVAIIVSNYFIAKNYLVHFKQNSANSIIILFSLLILAGTYISIIRGRSEVYSKRVVQLYKMENWNGVIYEGHSVSAFFFPLNNAATPVKLFSAKAWNQVKDPGSALLELKSALKQHPYHPEVILETIKTYELLDNQKRANKYAQRYIKLYPQQADIVFHLCQAYLDNEDYRSAYNLLRSKTEMSGSLKYHQFLITTLKHKTFDLISRVQHDGIIDILNSVNADENWLIRIHQKSLLENKKFEQQLLLDCIFTLENDEKSITPSEAEDLKSKFGLY